MIDEEEIERFRDNIPCPLPRDDCRWREEMDGSAWCSHCGSGYMIENRKRLARVYAAIYREEKSDGRS